MIGVFDSGFGGLTVLKEFLNLLPEYDYIYLGDNARAPYGNKAQEEIYQYTCEAIDFLFYSGCELVIIACNTASARALRRIQQEYLPVKYPDKRVLGVIIPVAEEMISIEKDAHIGVIGTQSTMDSLTYDKEIKKINPTINLHKQACPSLVSLLEEKVINKTKIKEELINYLEPLKKQQIQGLILGCTHYPVLFKDIQEIVGQKVKIFDTSKIIAKKLQKYLIKHTWLEKKLSKNSRKVFFTTGDPVRFKIDGEKFLGAEINNINKVAL